MAEDLRRFLDGRPIVARPTPTVEKLYLWCKRRPLVSSLIASVCLLISLLALVSTVAAFRLNDSLNQLQLAQMEEAAAQRSATRALFDSYLTQARAQMDSVSPGRHFKAIEAIQRAADLQGKLTFSDHDLIQLRSAAAKAFVVDDLSVSVSHKQDGHAYFHNNAGFDGDLCVVTKCTPDGQVWVYDLETQEVIQKLPGVWETYEIPWTLMSEDGRYVIVHGAIAGETCAFMIWDCEQSRVVTSITPTRQKPFGRPAAFSPDQTQVALVFCNSIEIVDLATAETTKLCDVHANVDFVRWAPDGSCLLIQDLPRACTVIPLSEPKNRVTLPHPDLVADADFGPFSRYVATACNDGVVRVWDLHAPTNPVTRCQGHAGAARIVRFSPDGHMLVSWGWDKTTRIWHPFLGQQILKTHRRPGLFSTNGGGLSFEEGLSLVGRWDLPSRETCETYFTASRGYVRDFSFHPDGHLIAIKCYKTLRVLSLPGWEFIAEMPHDEGQCSFSLDGNSLIVASGNELVSYRVDELKTESPEPNTLFSKPDIQTGAIRFSEESAEGNRVVHLGDQIVQTSVSGSDTRQLAFSDSSNHWFVASSFDGRLIATCGKWTDTLNVFDAETESLVLTMESAGGNRACFSPDGSLLAVSSRGMVRFVETTSWTEKFAVDNDEDFVGTVAFSPDGNLIAIHSGSEILVYASNGFQLLTRLSPRYGELLGNGYPDGTCPLKFSPDSRFLATGTRSCSLHVWDFESLKYRLDEMKLGW